MTHACYASVAEKSQGRLHPEPPSAFRTPFQRDRDRILHSEAFRRLKGKTQVFVAPDGDHIRTRLTHTLEAAQAARALARVLRLDEDLAEAVTLAHDLGHTPFGHAGEEALHAAMAPYGGFDHNAQSLRLLTRLERRYAEFDGLNLTWETLEGLAKHNGPLLRPGESPERLPFALRDLMAQIDLDPTRQASLEAQCAAVADDIAYNVHDIEDGLRAGFFALDELFDLPLVGACLRETDARWPGLDFERRRHEALRRLFGTLIEDVISESRARISDAAPDSPDAARAAPGPLVDFSPDRRGMIRQIQQFLFKRMYHHYKVARMSAKARRVIGDIFGLLLAQPLLLPDEWRARADGRDEAGRARAVADYIAGMTDRFALDEHDRLFNPSARA